MNRHVIESFPLLVAILMSLPFADSSAQSNPWYMDDEGTSWADSVMADMSLEEKIGQLFMIPVYSERDTAHLSGVLELIRDHHVGGVIFFQGGPERQQLMNDRIQSSAELPLLVAIDGEWGLSMRLDSTIRFPRQMTLGAAGDPVMVYEMGRQIGRECRAMGIHVNFAPVADINNNPRNPVINSRSFGENREKVAELAARYMLGLQAEGVIACGKHFPGHGNSDADSHLELPVIGQALSEIDSMELFPFRELVAQGIGSMMVAHLSIPAMIDDSTMPASLAAQVVDSTLRRAMGFEGLVFTDALNMKGVTRGFMTGAIEVMSLQAGNDILLMSEDPVLAIDSILTAISESRLSEERIDQSLRRILAAKHRVAIGHTGADGIAVKTGPLYEKSRHLAASLFKASATLLRNKKSALPLRDLKGNGIASLVVNDTLRNPFQLMLMNYAPLATFRCDRDPDPVRLDHMKEILANYECVIISIHNTSTKADKDYGISGRIDELIKELNRKVKVITVLFGNSYTITRIPSAGDSDGFIISYEDTYWPQHYTAQAIFGASDFTGMLPVSPNEEYHDGEGMEMHVDLGRLSYDLPLSKGIDPSALSRVDSVVMNAITEGAMPGCRVLFARGGTVVYNRSFGYHTYDSLTQVSGPDMYDIASITKIAATGLALMKLVDEGKIDINKKISRYLPELKRTNKKNLIISEILTHNSGLKPWLPVYSELLLENGDVDPDLVRQEWSETYDVTLSECSFMNKECSDKVWNAIKDSDVSKKGNYKYSDLGMIMMQKVIERITGMKLFDYVESNFYRPMGLHRLVINPASIYPLRKIVPTEIDTILRDGLIHGYVHDQHAAMMGGIAGHAGLFSDAESLAAIMQLLLNGGKYGGRRYLSEEVIKRFTSKFHEGSLNRRGLVFDKPQVIRTPDGPTAVSASDQAFGHSGFTGVCAWADPEYEMVYIFLSNRVYPTASNNKLAEMNVRTEVMEQFYRALENK